MIKPDGSRHASIVLAAMDLSANCQIFDSEHTISWNYGIYFDIQIYI